MEGGCDRRHAAAERTRHALRPRRSRGDQKEGEGGGTIRCSLPIQSEQCLDGRPICRGDCDIPAQLYLHGIRLARNRSPAMTANKHLPGGIRRLPHRILRADTSLANVLVRGNAGSPTDGSPSKLCATLVLPRWLRMDGAVTPSIVLHDIYGSRADATSERRSATPLCAGGSGVRSSQRRPKGCVQIKSGRQRSMSRVAAS
jgi:hypothetical protein